jgi:hypothetical protein
VPGGTDRSYIVALAIFFGGSKPRSGSVVTEQRNHVGAAAAHIPRVASLPISALQARLTHWWKNSRLDPNSMTPLGAERWRNCTDVLGCVAGHCPAAGAAGGRRC